MAEPVTLRKACRERGVIAVLAIAVAVRLLVFGLNYPFPPLAKDDSVYDILAVNMLEGHGFSMSPTPPYEPMAARAPGYPAFLAGVYAVAGHNPDAVRVVQLLLALVTCILVYAIGRRLVPPVTAMAAGLIYATLPSAAQYPSLVLTESLHALLLTWALYIVYRCTDPEPRITWYVALGLVLGVAALVRPDYQLLLFPLVGLVVWAQGRPWWTLPRVGVAVACFALVVVPWVARNYSTFGRFVGLATGSGHVLLVAELEAEGVTGRALDQALQERYGAPFRQRYHREMTYLDGALPDQDETRRQDFLKFLQAEPDKYARHTLQRFAAFWGPRSWSDAFGVDGDFSEYRRSRDWVPLLVKASLLVFDAVVLGLAALGAIVAIAGWRRFLPVLAVLAYATAIHSLVYAGARYRVPVLPFVAILAGIGLSVMVTLASRKPQGLKALLLVEGEGRAA